MIYCTNPRCENGRVVMAIAATTGSAGGTMTVPCPSCYGFSNGATVAISVLQDAKTILVPAAGAPTITIYPSATL